MIGAWNMEGMLPPNNSIKRFVDAIVGEFKSEEEKPDIVCIATQECQRSISMSFFCEDKKEWESALCESANGYVIADSSTMNALHTAILVKKDLLNCYTTEKTTFLKAGKCNLLGNKGAISIVVNLLGQNLQFINCHLEANQNQNNRRNEVLLKIVDEMVEKDYRNEVFICGDLNYRIDFTNEEYQRYIGKGENTDEVMKYSDLFSKDQLTNQEILQEKFLPFFREQKITFPPTYKLGENDDKYNKERIPGWTDRIFQRKGRAEQLEYDCLYDLYGTDHRPVYGSFKVETEESLTIFANTFVGVKQSGCCLI